MATQMVQQQQMKTQNVIFISFLYYSFLANEKKWVKQCKLEQK